MKTISLILLALIFLTSCDTSSDEIVNASKTYNYDLIKLPKRSAIWMDSVFTISKEIDGVVGGEMTMERYYISEDDDSIFVEADLRIPKGAYQGVKTITMSIDTQDATIQFYPEMVFDKELKFSQSFWGINLDNYPNGTIDFYYVTTNGSVELVKKNGIQIVRPQGLLRVLEAKLHHFSRYGWIRKAEEGG